LIQEQRQLLLS